MSDDVASAYQADAELCKSHLRDLPVTADDIVVTVVVGGQEYAHTAPLGSILADAVAWAVMKFSGYGVISVIGYQIGNQGRKISISESGAIAMATDDLARTAGDILSFDYSRRRFRFAALEDDARYRATHHRIESGATPTT